jgi:hypothetical protein
MAVPCPSACTFVKHIRLLILVLINNPVAAKSQIELQQVLFTGGIHFHPNGSVYIKDTPGPKYVGTPSPEIDKAWDDLLYG